MAATAALVAISAYSAISQNQTNQKAKGDAAKLQKTQDDAFESLQKSAPSVLDETNKAQQERTSSLAAVRRKSSGGTGRAGTLLTGPLGTTTPVIAERKTLLGL